MDVEYDKKFEEMKKYIPFLENMIKRLESSEQASNPRQAQLDKIRSLRDLLLDKKKRMKMENLLKCEQVLINLYAKVEQRNMHQSGDVEKASTEKDKTDLNAVRNKLKSMVMPKFSAQETTETLPEIARASKTEEICVQGSKEPALFQRRPNKGSNPVNTSSTPSAHESEGTPSKRSYTRVLESPEASESRWRSSAEKSEKQLFSRRSPHRRTESSSRKERKKLKQKGKNAGDLNVTNITLQVPEESLSSLNTDDILSRIINCSDGDVDISTLRDLRTQILGELKKTGSKDDISDLILKSYKKKDKRKKNDEMEDGELSDSESETIKNVYSSIVVLDKDKKAKTSVNQSTDTDAPRIQICLVFNKEQDTPKPSSENKVDVTDFENYHENKSENKMTKGKGDKKADVSDIQTNIDNSSLAQVTKTLSVEDDELTQAESIDNKKVEFKKSVDVISNSKNNEQRSKDNAVVGCLTPSIEEKHNPGSVVRIHSSSTLVKSPTSEKLQDIKANVQDTFCEETDDIPLLNLEETSKKEVASEIDILQALKQEILSETSTVLHTNVDTPALHQPKITKVQNTLETGTKKRISIENYKAKTINPIENKKSQLPMDTDDDLLKKQSLKLTKKECERFNFLSKLALHDSSDDEDQSSFPMTDIYTDLAPKSPDHDDFADTGLKPPIIIPNDPVGKIVTTTDSDVDMRKLTSLVCNSAVNNEVLSNSICEIPDVPQQSNVGKDFYVENNTEKKSPLLDPRMKRDSNLKIDPAEFAGNLENLSRPITGFDKSSQCTSTHNIVSALAHLITPNITASLVPNITPVPAPIPFSNMSPVQNIHQQTPILPHNLNLATPLVPPLLPPVLANNIIGNMTPIMTPNARTYEMTPSRLSIDSDDFSKDKHVYPPTFTNYDTHENENKNDTQKKEWNKGNNRIPIWEHEKSSENHFSVWEESNARNNFKINKHYQGKQDASRQCYNDNKYRYDNCESYNSLECPPTPTHSFGRFDCPPTPTPSFGRSDMQSTPIHSFGRSDYTQRSSNNNITDPRRSRVSDYNNRDSDRERRHFNERDYNSHSYRSNNQNNHFRNNYDSRQYGRETSAGRYDRYEGNRRLNYSETSVEDNYYTNRRRSHTRDDYYNQSRTNHDYNQRGYRDYSTKKLPSSKTYEYNYSTEDKLTVHSNTSKDCTIDTNVSKTFHQSSERDNSFDKRRQRAASVGRTLDRDCIDFKLNKQFTFKENDVTHSPQNKERFRRAASVGREIVKASEDFKIIKEDLKSFKLRSDSKIMKNCRNVDDITLSLKSINKSECCESNKKKNDKLCDTKNISSSNRYSPKKNIRDPRISSKQDNRGINKYHDNKDKKHRKNHGIVYSNDNISKGTILGSGYGVKNYKIPKIKRPSTESEISESIEIKQTNSTNNDAKNDTKPLQSFHEIDERVKMKQTTTKIENTETLSCAENNEEANIDSETKIIIPIQIDKTNIDIKVKTAIQSEDLILSKQVCEVNDKNIKIQDDICKSDEDIVEKRVTRSARKKILDQKKESFTLRKPRKVGKIYYSESDSDEDNIHPNKQENEKNKKSVLKNDTQSVAELKNSEKCNEYVNFTKCNNDQEGSIKIIRSISTDIADDALKCPIDGLETFEENLVSDPVVDNINSLIADLDHDLGVHSAKDSSLENENLEIIEKHMNQNITDTSDPKVEETKLDESNLPGKKDTNIQTAYKSVSLFEENLKRLPNKNEECKNKHENNQTEKQNITGELNKDESPAINTTDSSLSDLNSDQVVSTTEKCESEEGSMNYDKVETTLCNDDANNLENLPDSTGVSENVINFSTEVSTNFVADTEEHTKSENETSLEQKLLLLLKDKTKMKELISKLSSDTCANDKMKKKLEKLSEIVSDDEENTQNEVIESSIKTDNKTDCNFDLEKDLYITDSNYTQKHEIADTEVSVDKQSISITKNEKTNNPATSAEAPKENMSMCEDNTLLNLDRSDHTVEIPLTENNDCVKDDSDTCKKEKVDIESANNNLLADTKLDSINESQKSNNVICFQDQKNMLTKQKPKGKKYKKKGKLNKIVKPVKSNISAKNGQSKVKKPSRELKRLQEDLREMKEDILASTGIRMCRLAKMVNDHRKDEQTVTENESVVEDHKPDSVEKDVIDEKETLTNINTNNESKSINDKKPLIRKPGPKSKTKSIISEEYNDPYEFETDSISESIASESKNESSSDSESEHVNITAVSEKKTEKKKMRRKRGWQAGIIKPKNRKKMDTKSNNSLKIPDYNCFTDKSYCFKPNTLEYSCRLCVYTGTDIVPHYMKHHPHSEIPLSRLCPDSAAEAMKQCEEVNIKAISKMPSNKYTCRFCFMEISKKKFILEEFFWHVVSTHTGEYKQQCSQCKDTSKCPFSNDIPPPPENVKGQLLGYICSKCNFTQVSMENLKTHVIIRHNNEETHVYTINLSVITKKAINIYLRNTENLNAVPTIDEPRKLRSNRSKQSLAESSDEEISVCNNSTEKPEQITNIKSKITFESDNLTDTVSDESSIKTEPVQEIINTNDSSAGDNQLVSDNPEKTVSPNQDIIDPTPSNDIFTNPHFKITYKNGLKEYVCCINGNDFHYKTSLLISIRKHVQMKHRENWDGYCSMCKVIVTPQGKHNFKDCLNHYIDKHIDEFPVVDDTQDEKVAENSETQQEQDTESEKNNSTKSYLTVKPLNLLLSTANEAENSDSSSGLPVIESVVSLNMADQPLPSPNYPKPSSEEPVVEYKYEEAQADIMSKKHRVVLEAMMNNTHLVQIFKCAGKFCSFSTDNAEEALLHASTHVRIGGEYALGCVYCDYDAGGNAIDLVTHVFKKHGCCPYVCGVCFYRAAASQLVHAHINRVHPNSNAEVLRTTVVTGATDDDDFLPRRTAVPFYCCSGEPGGPSPCKFRTYTPGKFCEHVQTRHLNAPQMCFICSEPCLSATELVRHLKTHGLRLYQCTRCVFGADNEPDLLLHASAKHPAKQPTAYLRIITNKEGSAEYKVLPLAHLNNSKVAVTEVVPKVSAKNPVREAERARELETLIGETTSMIESISTSADTSAASPPSTSEPSPAVPSPIPGGACPLVLPMLLTSCRAPAGRSGSPSTSKRSTDVTTAPAPLDRPLHTQISNPTPAPPEAAISYPNAAESLHLVTPKIEPSDSATADDARDLEDNLAQDSSVPEAPATTAAGGSTVKSNINIDHVVYCLDSDEETFDENVIDLSDEQPSASVASSSTIKVKLGRLFKCSKCSMITRSGHGLKRHIRACYGFNPETVVCAYCGIAIKQTMIDAHLIRSHLEENGKFAYVCPVCLVELKSIPDAQEHFKSLHLDTHGKKVVWKMQEVGIHSESLSQAQKIIKVDQIIQSTRPKRKRSIGNKDKAEEPPEKVKKFGPQDIDKLPINPILDELVYCALCEFSTKVRLNMVRHLQLHAQQQPVADSAPVNPVPHLETNEMHFDKMLNLASSSRALDRAARADHAPPAMRRVPLENVGRYPRYVPDRQRHTCGAKDCSYISVDESMLKCHWETLHAGTTDYHCVHCPPTQHLNGQITTGRIVNHLKMHDISLYACSLCSYYHYKIPLVEKHLTEAHKRGEVLIVRDESSVAVVAPAPGPTSAPTMDLKPWQCGLCEYRSLLRPEVVEHCAKMHNSKMQYKCGYCAFRTSNVENVSKHQSTSHAGRPVEVFYYYYREGSIPNEADGSPRWMKQKQSTGSPSQVKAEVADGGPAPPAQPVVLPAIVQKVDLNLVKKEVADVSEDGDLCQEFGEFCEPNGLKYKCPLCQSVTEYSEEMMQSHLYEELKYRKWGCPVCSYKAFHKAGFKEHAQTEHVQFPNLEPHQLPVDSRIELWTAKLLEHQTAIIVKNKEKLAIQKEEIKRTTLSATTSQSVASKPSSSPKRQAKSSKEVEALFGPYGKPAGVLYCCPKCSATFREENDMREHLESELSKIRWYCSTCSDTFTTYHEAQFHCSARCKSTQAGVYSRPTEATRDATLRTNWVESAVRSQTTAINEERSTFSTAPQEDESDQGENSLLVVRYERQVSTPEEMARAKPPETDTVKSAESSKQEGAMHRCPHCSYITPHAKLLTSHILKHYDLKPCFCPYCGLGGNRKQVTKHQRTSHPQDPVDVIDTVIPRESPQEYLKKKLELETELICLVCRKPFAESAARTHRHNNFKPDFGREGASVVMCCVCSMLYKEVTGCLNHHRACHPRDKVDYVSCKLSAGLDVSCSACSAKFTTADELKAHILLHHPEESAPRTSNETDTSVAVGSKRKSKDDILPVRKVARKSTSKQHRPFAKKSTTKLPRATLPEEYSYYGRRQPSEDLDKSILIPFCNTMVPFTVRKIPEIFGNPIVSVKKLSDT